MTKTKKSFLLGNSCNRHFGFCVGVLAEFARKDERKLHFHGTVQESTFDKLPNVPFVEVYHDGNVFALVTVEKLIEGRNPYRLGAKIALILKDYDQFGGAGFRINRFRVTLKKYVEHDGFEYWQCSAVKL